MPQVQDMLNPEYFVGAYQQPDGTWSTTVYSDTPPANLSAAIETKIWERKPLYCTLVPSETEWMNARWTGQPPEPPTPCGYPPDTIKQWQWQAELPT